MTEITCLRLVVPFYLKSLNMEKCYRFVLKRGCPLVVPPNFSELYNMGKIIIGTKYCANFNFF